jgi:UDP-glucose 4-epimerase
MVLRAAAGCDAVVHLAAILPPDPVSANELMAVNLLGTWHVLWAAKERRLRRVVYASSVNALGVFLGHRRPDYLPIDDDHPSYARQPYPLSKRLSELMCQAFTEDTGISAICLRPPMVVAPNQYEQMRRRWAQAAEREWTPVWEYGAFLDVRDVATAVHRALVCPDPGYVTLLLCADDIAAAAPALERVRQLLPSVPWRGGAEYAREPNRALVSNERAKAVLGWAPRYRWSS